MLGLADQAAGKRRGARRNFRAHLVEKCVSMGAGGQLGADLHQAVLQRRRDVAVGGQMLHLKVNPSGDAGVDRFGERRWLGRKD